MHDAAPRATLIGSHMEAVNHCVLTRAELRAFAKQESFSDSLLSLPTARRSRSTLKGAGRSNGSAALLAETVVQTLAGSHSMLLG